MADVFISYSSKDRDKIERLISALRDHKITYWIDNERIPKGIEYDDVIPNAISNAPILVILLSKNSVESEDVKNELRIAKGLKKHIIPIMLDNTELKDAFEYHIKSNNRIDAVADLEKAIAELISHLKTYLDNYNSKQCKTDKSIFNTKEDNEDLGGAEIFASLIVIALFVALIYSAKNIKPINEFFCIMQGFFQSLFEFILLSFRCLGFLLEFLCTLLKKLISLFDFIGG